MTTYTAITNGEIDQDSPVTQPLLTALRDNPIAIAEGASDAPRIDGAALENVFLGFSSLSGWSSAFTFKATQTQYIIAKYNFASPSPSNFTPQVRFSTDGGSSWGSGQAILGNTASQGDYWLALNLQDGTGQTLTDFIGAGTTTTVTVPSGADAISFYALTSGAVMAFCLGGVS
jgi:hypothetical protein